jgi:peptidoglycan/xylan/chitin deacetylase (PgdA/CDA1 family)
MGAARTRLAAILILLVAASLPTGGQESREAPPYSPKGERLEILKPWEKRAGAPPPPEIVAGIYERDYRRYDFKNELALTIDDAAPNKYLEMELEVLKERGVKAVFFIIGSYFVWPSGKPMPRAKELLERLLREGHEIGSHTYYHQRLDEGRYLDSPLAIRAELDRNEAVIDRILGYHYPIRFFRPPNGAHASPGYVLDRVLLERGQYLTNWTITSFDWNIRYKPDNPEHLSPEKVIARTVKQAREDSGGVILFHGFPSSAAILDDLIQALSASSNERGRFVFSSLDELMRLKYG